jgi:glycine betaine/choline ABC-type transport system substrate-binding protein
MGAYSLMYRAIANKEVDVIADYSTDSGISKLNLIILEDNKEFFPDYSAAYAIDMDTLKSTPQSYPYSKSSAAR